MVKTKLKLKESLKNLKSAASEQKALEGKKKAVSKAVAQSESESESEEEEEEEEEESDGESDSEEEDNDLETDAANLIRKENGEPALSHKDQRKLKKALKRAAKQAAEEESDEDFNEFNTNKLLESDSEGEESDLGNFKDSDNENEDEEDVPLSDAELDEDADVVPYQKVIINNRKALVKALSEIALPLKDLKFSEYLSVTSSEPLVLKDVHDDLERELSFYKQGLAAVKIGRTELTREKVSFSRPIDYFAEMVKSDEHMDRLKVKLVETETAKKAGQDARRQRELKKFGKQVQHQKLQDRAKDKRETLDKIKSLKRKRAGNEISTGDFDIAVEEAATESNDKRGSSNGRGRGDGKPGARRQAKNSKYGSGGKKKYSKSNTAESSNDMSGFSNKRMKTGGPKSNRPGKSKRAPGKF